MAECRPSASTGLSKRRCRRPLAPPPSLRPPPAARLASRPGHDAAGSEEATPSTVVCYYTCHQLSLCQSGTEHLRCRCRPPIGHSPSPTKQASEWMHERVMTPTQVPGSTQVHYYLYRREYLLDATPSCALRRTTHTTPQRGKKTKQNKTTQPSSCSCRPRHPDQPRAPRHQR